jgi:hypothetical protein
MLTMVVPDTYQLTANCKRKGVKVKLQSQFMQFHFTRRQLSNFLYKPVYSVTPYRPMMPFEVKAVCLFFFWMFHDMHVLNIRPW